MVEHHSRAFAALSYVFGFFIALIIFLVKKDDKYARYHSAQALLSDILTTLASIIVFALGAAVFSIDIASIEGLLASFWHVLTVLGLGAFILRLFLAWKAYRGSEFRLPIISNIAQKIA